MFFKKEETIESLMKECNKEYSSFLYSYTKAHYQSYFDFKQTLKNDFNYLKDCMANSTKEDLTLDLLKTFKAQLKFINTHPFSADVETMQPFLAEHFPYKEKVDTIITKHNQAKKFNF